MNYAMRCSPPKLRATTCVPSFFCPRVRTTSEVVVYVFSKHSSNLFSPGVTANSWVVIYNQLLKIQVPATRKHGWSKHGSSIIPQDLYNPCLNLMNSARTMFTPTMFSRHRKSWNLLPDSPGASQPSMHTFPETIAGFTMA